MLYDMQSVKFHGGRGTNTGFLYNQDGTLAITCAQEALIRLTKPEINLK